jgi:hypothetical protein
VVFLNPSMQKPGQYPDIRPRPLPSQSFPICDISSSHGGEYETQNLLGSTAMFLIGCRPTFQMCVLRPSSS